MVIYWVELAMLSDLMGYSGMGRGNNEINDDIWVTWYVMGSKLGLCFIVIHPKIEILTVVLPIAYSTIDVTRCMYVNIYIYIWLYIYIYN